MNKIKLLSVVMISFLVIGSLNGVTAIKADAGEYLGDYCWNYSNPTLGALGTLQLGVTHIGGSHCLCSGVFTVTDPISKQFPAYGNAELVGGEIYVTLSLAGIRNDVIGIDMIKAKLVPTNLNGTFEHIGVYPDAVELSEGTLTYTTCQ
jgi:hypothetical protein